MKICIIGTGYVGLVSGTCFAEIGHNVVCIDIDKKKIDKLNRGLIPIYEPGLEELVKRNSEQGRLKFSSDVSLSIKNSNIVFICVGTPTNKITKNADLKYLFNVANNIKNKMATNCITGGCSCNVCETHFPSIKLVPVGHCFSVMN